LDKRTNLANPCALGYEKHGDVNVARARSAVDWASLSGPRNINIWRFLVFLGLVKLQSVKYTAANRQQSRLGFSGEPSAVKVRL